MLETLLSLVLGLSLLPSFTALTAYTVPFLGPINLLKITAPLFVIFLYQNRSRIPKKASLWFLIVFAIGTISTFVSGARCTFPEFFIREWAVTLLGTLAALCFFIFQPHTQKRVVKIWIALVLGSAAIDLLSPTTNDWLLNKIFDPRTKQNDYLEIGRSTLTGVFGRQSMAKFLAWLPWLTLFFLWNPQKKTNPSWLRYTPLLLPMICTGLVLSTSQRGPFLSLIVSWIGFLAYAALILKNKSILKTGVAAFALGIVLVPVLVPTEILVPRIQSLLGVQSANEFTKIAQSNSSVRVGIHKITWDVMKHHPFGNACIPEKVFIDTIGINSLHGHHLFLHQFRDRGWFYGAAHLILWLVAGLGFLKLRGWRGAFGLSTYLTIFITGQFDHPWFVLNQALILGVVLWVGVSAFTAERN